MAMFQYQALTTTGRFMSGAVEANSAEQATEMLQEMQLKVNTIEKASTRKSRTAIGRNEFLLFNQQLAAITKSGIPLEKGLHELANDVASRSTRKLITAIADDLESGTDMEQAFEKHTKNFPSLYSQIIKAGIQSGRLSEMLTSLNRHLEMTNQTRRIMFEALCYPLVILVLAAVVVTGLFNLVIPQFEEIYLDFGIELPDLTKFVMSFAHNPVFNVAVIGLTILSLVVLGFLLSLFPAGKRLKETIYLNIPVFGRLYRYSLLSRLADSMALLVGAGTELPTSFRLAVGTTGSEKLKADVNLIVTQLEQGSNIVECSRSISTIPRLFFYSIQLGSQRNELQDNLYGLSDMYSHQVACNQARLEAILLPIMIIIVGGILAVTISALFLPLVTMMHSLQ